MACRASRGTMSTSSSRELCSLSSTRRPRPWRRCDGPASAPSSSRGRSSSDGSRTPGRRGFRSTSTCSSPALTSRPPRTHSPPAATPRRRRFPAILASTMPASGPHSAAFRSSCTGRSSAPTNVGSGRFSQTRPRPRRSQVSIVEIPNEAARCLIVALHAAQHGVGAAQTLHDLERALATAGEDVWVRALELAVAVGAETPFVCRARSHCPRPRAPHRARASVARTDRPRHAGASHLATHRSRLLGTVATPQRPGEGAVPPGEARSGTRVHATPVPRRPQRPARSSLRVPVPTVVAGPLGGPGAALLAEVPATRARQPVARALTKRRQPRSHGQLAAAPVLPLE